jgi:hypothetical protein
MVTFPSGTSCDRRRRQTSRLEFAAGQRSFGFFDEPVALLIPPLSFFDLSGELRGWGPCLSCGSLE